jgi:chemotaxis signal transduction protein
MSGEQQNEALASLQEAASQLTQGSEAPTADATAIPLLIARVGTRWVAVPVKIVQEVVLKDFVTRVPRMPEHVLGAAVIRSRVVPVISIAALLHADEAAELVPTLPRLIVLETPEGEVAVVADEVRGIAPVPSAQLSDGAERARGGPRPGWVTAEITWNERLLCILDVPRLCAAALGEEVTL